jgi:hypothetical protein
MVEGVLIVAGHRSRSGTVQLTSVEIESTVAFCQVDSGDAAVVVVHGDVQDTAHISIEMG